jgi:hypothetical protein
MVMNGLGKRIPQGDRDWRDSAWKKPSALSRNMEAFMGVGFRSGIAQQGCAGRTGNAKARKAYFVPEIPPIRGHPRQGKSLAVTP